MRDERTNEGTIGDRRTAASDPSALTTNAIHREIRNLRELMEQAQTGMAETWEEKFDSTEMQFRLIEQQRLEQKVDTKSAVDAALIAQKEAVREQTIASERAIAKSETATTKSIDQLAETFKAAFDGQRRDIDDLKSRITIVEAIKTGGQEKSTSHAQNFGVIVGGGGLLLTLLSIALVVLSKV